MSSRALIGLALLLAIATACRDEDTAAIDVGALDSFDPRTATYFALIDRGRVVRYEEGAAINTPAAFEYPDPRLDFFITRSTTDDVVALLAVDPTSACPLAPPTHAATAATALSEPCFNSSYDLYGYRLAGPIPRDIPRLPAHVVNGRVLVDARLPAVTNSDGTPYRQVVPGTRQVDVTTAGLAPGEARSYVLLEDGSVLQYAMDASVPPPTPDRPPPVIPRVAFHLVRTDARGLLAFYPTAPSALRCPVEWYPSAFEGNNAFKEGCGGAYFSFEGHRLFGPAGPELLHLPIEIHDNGVRVTISRDSAIRTTPARDTTGTRGAR